MEAINWESSGFTDVAAEWRKIKFSFEDMKNRRRDAKDYLSRNFAMKWCASFPWLRVRHQTPDQPEIFAPQFVCKSCNDYFSHNPQVRHRHKNAFALPRNIIHNEVQTKTLRQHQKSHSHQIAIGAAASNADLNTGAIHILRDMKKHNFRFMPPAPITVIYKFCPDHGQLA